MVRKLFDGRKKRQFKDYKREFIFNIVSPRCYDSNGIRKPEEKGYTGTLLDTKDGYRIWLNNQDQDQIERWWIRKDYESIYQQRKLNGR